MKFLRTSCIVTAIMAVPLLTPAVPAMPPNALGSIEATIMFCARVDSKSADKYKELGKRATEGMTEKEVADARASSEYKGAYTAITTDLEKMPVDKAAEACRGALEKPKK
jgi:hypothetical protein